MDIDSIYMLKNCKVDVKSYAKAIIGGAIGFEALHFYLFRIHKALLLVDILWKILLIHENSSKLFKYIFEAIITQTFEEYSFVKGVLKALEESWTDIQAEAWTVDFLYFYEHFVWKNKRFIEIYDNCNWYFKQNLIRFPSLYYDDDATGLGIRSKLIEMRALVDKRKHFIKNKISYRKLGEISGKYFKELCADGQGGEKDWLLFSRRSILNKLNSDKTQSKVNRDEARYLNQTSSRDTTVKVDEGN